MAEEGARTNHNDESVRAEAGSNLSNTKVIINDGAAKWIVIVFLAFATAYAVVRSETTYEKADQLDRDYTLTYTHLIKIDAYLTDNGAPAKVFSPLDAPQPRRKPKP